MFVEDARNVLRRRAAARAVLPQLRRPGAARQPAARRRARRRPDEPRDRSQAGVDLRHAVRPGGHPRADQPPRRHHRPDRGGRRHLHPVQHRRAHAAGDPAGGDHRPPMRAARRRAGEAAPLQGRRALLDRDPSARERGRPDRSSGRRRALQAGPGHDVRDQVEGRLRACSRRRSTPPRTPPTWSSGSSSSMPEGFTAILVAVLGLAVLFDYINGFHDTANAIATSVARARCRRGRSP